MLGFVVVVGIEVQFEELIVFEPVIVGVAHEAPAGDLSRVDVVRDSAVHLVA